VTWNSRLDVVETLERAGWIGDEGFELSILRHRSGAVFAVYCSDGGECGIDGPGGVNCGEFSGETPDAVVVAAALAASGQLVPEVTVKCDAEGHAMPHTPGCSQAEEPAAEEYRYCGGDLGRTEPPYTCNRRIRHKGGCGPEHDDQDQEQGVEVTA